MIRKHYLLERKQLRRQPHLRYAFDESVRASEASPENFQSVTMETRSETVKIGALGLNWVLNGNL